MARNPDIVSRVEGGARPKETQRLASAGRFNFHACSVEDEYLPTVVGVPDLRADDLDFFSVRMDGEAEDSYARAKVAPTADAARLQEFKRQRLVSASTTPAPRPMTALAAAVLARFKQEAAERTARKERAALDALKHAVLRREENERLAGVKRPPLPKAEWVTADYAARVMQEVHDAPRLLATLIARRACIMCRAGPGMTFAALSPSGRRGICLGCAAALQNVDEFRGKGSRAFETAMRILRGCP